MRESSSPITATATSDTTITPRSCFENATPPTWIGVVENGPANCCTAPPQIHVSSPLIAISRPMVRITMPSSGPPSSGRISVACNPMPPANDRMIVTANAGQNDQP